MAPLISSCGFTADVHPCKTTVRAKRRGQRTFVLSALGVSFVFVLALLPSLGMTDTVDTSNSANTSQVLGYDFKIYALNCTSQKHTPTGTLFKFNTADLPFNISAISFGDHSSDTTYSHKYYGGSGILVNATGSNATMILRESNGQLVSTIEYHGQAQVVFNGQVVSVTYPTSMTTYEGTEQMIQDWRSTTWTPGDGIIVEHPSAVDLGDAKFFVMTLEPDAITEIPEFEAVPIVVGVAALFILVRRAASKR